MNIAIVPSTDVRLAPVVVVMYPDGRRAIGRRLLTPDEESAAYDAGALVTTHYHARLYVDGDLSPFDTRCLLGEIPDPTTGELPPR